MQLTTAGGRGETHSQACSQPAPLTHYYYYDYYYYFYYYDYYYDYYYYFYYYYYYYLAIITNAPSPAAPTSSITIKNTTNKISSQHRLPPLLPPFR